MLLRPPAIVAAMKTFATLVVLANLVAGFLAPDGTVIIPGASSYNGLALTPAMGWDNVCERSLKRYRNQF